MRTNEGHRNDVESVLAEEKITSRSKRESEVGFHYSVLLDLKYFCPIEMLIVN